MTRGNDGKFKKDVTDGELLHYFDTREQPVLSAGDVADEFDIKRQTADRRLKELEEEGELKRIIFGERSQAWWRERDQVVLVKEETGFSAHDVLTGIASDGESRVEALRELADAIEAHTTGGEVKPDQIYEELDIDPEENSGGEPPF
ncbi:hypothetical protein EGO51_18590 [Haloarcula hispanica]|jgi:predicted ArsR family transcriptional regulator|uniref:HTH domain-containing protein n=1 Tax=Haloarcula hispanica TaxID=51589 RepID=A0A5J5LCG0_HALHI|nr:MULTISPECIES: hypothetical protein [Haloarcula]KAA9404711.1 hypothetical protein EGO51_18590 [Haloarcula hispanica]MUV49765.1 hypothetical protein [Haloarcula sp. CBA1122]